MGDRGNGNNAPTNGGTINNGGFPLASGGSATGAEGGGIGGNNADAIGGNNADKMSEKPIASGMAADSMNNTSGIGVIPKSIVDNQAANGSLPNGSVKVGNQMESKAKGDPLYEPPSEDPGRPKDPNLLRVGGSGEVSVVFKTGANGERVKYVRKKLQVHEIEILQRLERVNDIVRVHSIENNQVLFDFIEGAELENLRKHLAGQGKVMEPTFVAAIIRQLLVILQAIHEKGLTHYDIKPHNVILSESDGRVKLIDFDYAGDTDSTFFGGTDDYKQPENIRSPAADVWMVGVMTTFLLRGRNLREGREVFLRGLKNTYESLPSSALEFAESCLQRNSSDRAKISDLLNSKFIVDGADDHELARWIRESIAEYRMPTVTSSWIGRRKLDSIRLKMSNQIPVVLIGSLLPTVCSSSASTITSLDPFSVEVEIQTNGQRWSVSLAPEFGEALKYPEAQLKFFNTMTASEVKSIADLARYKEVDQIILDHLWTFMLNPEGVKIPSEILKILAKHETPVSDLWRYAKPWRPDCRPERELNEWIRDLGNPKIHYFGPEMPFKNFHVHFGKHFERVIFHFDHTPGLIPLERVVKNLLTTRKADLFRRMPEIAKEIWLKFVQLYDLGTPV